MKESYKTKYSRKIKWRHIFGKLRKLGTAIEMYYGSSMDIDNVDYRWVNDRIEYFDKNRRTLTKDEMETANELWKKVQSWSKYGKKA